MRASLPLRPLLALGLLAIAAGCDSNDEFDADAYVGTYTGTATATVSGQAQPPRPFTVTIAIPADGVVTMTFDVGPQGEDDPAPATVTGTYDDDGARFATPSGQTNPAFDLRIAASGRITGDVSFTNFFGSALSLDASGTASPSRFDLTITAAAQNASIRLLGTK